MIAGVVTFVLFKTIFCFVFKRTQVFFQVALRMSACKMEIIVTNKTSEKKWIEKLRSAKSNTRKIVRGGYHSKTFMPFAKSE